MIASVLQTASGKRKKVSVFGSAYPTPDGTAIRNYIHVSDLADAHARALDYLRQGRPSEFLNLASGRGHSVLEVIECARQITGRPIATEIAPPRPGDPSRLVADASKAQEVLGWTSRRSDLATIVRSAWNWHLRHPNGYARHESLTPESLSLSKLPESEPILLFFRTIAPKIQSPLLATKCHLWYFSAHCERLSCRFDEVHPECAQCVHYTVNPACWKMCPQNNKEHRGTT